MTYLKAKRRHRRTISRPLRLESLEGRQMMSGVALFSELDAVSVRSPVEVCRFDCGKGPDSTITLPTLPVTSTKQTVFRLDYGDAPDSLGYATRLADDGARHLIVSPNPDRLGKDIDYETDGQPHPDALGDDMSRDDEDGIAFHKKSPLMSGQQARVTADATIVNKSGTARLNAWIDFNQDGDWLDAGEQIIKMAQLNHGLNGFTFEVPRHAAIGTTYARFRMSPWRYPLVVQPTGLVRGGEVEDYKVAILPGPPVVTPYDFGDAPDSYGTTLATGGARHTIQPGMPVLGSFVDAEPNGQPSVDTNGDNRNHLADEDGISITGSIIPGQSIQVVATTTRTGPLSSFYLQGWMDWNGDGDFYDTGEQIISNGRISISHIAWLRRFSVRVPNNVTSGSIYARFRYSSQQHLGPTGLAPDGEVEDYRVDPPSWADSGDLPNSYGTTMSAHGARHLPDPSQHFFLGAGVDYEGDGQPDTSAQADDQNGSVDDEDGVIVRAVARSGGTDVTIDVTGTTPSTGHAPMFLQAWMDWNDDGDFADLGEQIITNGQLTSGGIVTQWHMFVPHSITEVYARFRYSSQSGLGPTGVAPDGEVEDYRVRIVRPQMDCGDLPDSYGTTTAMNGACHDLDPARPYYLGSGVDADPDGQPSTDAVGDDQYDSNDDEDGVTIQATAIPGGGTRVTVSASGTTPPAGQPPMLLQGWLDWNGDGDFDPSERIILDGMLQPGGAISSWSGQVAHSVTEVYARFRYSSVQGLGPTGRAPDGEVEDYKIRVKPSPPMDYGDAPDSYGTKTAVDGARHILDPNRFYFLGASVDRDLDGQPRADALGDDQDTSGDDEDGVIVRAVPIQGGTHIVAEVSGTTPPAGQPPMYLQAWIDWNGDGDFNDTNEQIIQNATLNPGGVVTQFDGTVPYTLTLVNARFRYSSQPNLGPTGLARDGEVEDYVFVAGLPGDANLDGRVGHEDLAVLTHNFGSSAGTWSSGDFDGDGIVGLSDFFILRNAYKTQELPPPAENWTTELAKRPQINSTGDFRTSDGRSLGDRRSLSHPPYRNAANGRGIDSRTSTYRVPDSLLRQ